MLASRLTLLLGVASAVVACGESSSVGLRADDADTSGPDANGSNDATVRIYLGGVLAWEETRTITGENDYVPYAEIGWPDGGVNPL